MFYYILYYMGNKKRKGIRVVDADSAWKGIIEDLFEDFIAYFFPLVHRDIDFGRGIEFLNIELRKFHRRNDVGKRFADVLAKVYLRGGGSTSFLIHIEVQNTRDDNLPERMFVYNYRAFDRFRRKGRNVVSLAVLTDEDKNWRPDVYTRKPGKWGYELRMKFPMAKLLDFYDFYGPEQCDNPIALVVFAHLMCYKIKGAKDELYYHLKYFLFRICFSYGFKEFQVEPLLRFIDFLIEVPVEFERKLCEDIEKFKEEFNMPYITSFERIGREDGKKEALMETAKRMLLENFPLETIARCTRLKEEDISALA